MSRTAFSARQVYDIAPLGSLIRFYDGTPEPPARHGQERAEWSKANGTGRLMRKTPASDLTVPGFRLHVGGLGGDLTLAQAHRSFTVSSDLRFAILGKPRRGQALVLRDEGDGIPTLVHLARTVPEAETWLNAHAGRRARIVPADTPIPRTFTYLNDIDHGWLIVSRPDLDEVGLSPADSPRGAISAATALLSMSTATCRSSWSASMSAASPTACTTGARKAMPTSGSTGSATSALRAGQQVHDPGLSKYCAF